MAVLDKDQDEQTNKWVIAQNQNDPWGGLPPLAPPPKDTAVVAPQPPVPATPALAPTDSGASDEDDEDEVKNDDRIQDSHPGHAPDDLATYVKGQEAQIDKYGPEQEKAVMENIMKNQGSLGNRFARGAAGLGDAIMGVAGKQSPGFLSSLENRENNQNKMALEMNPTLQKMTAENLGAKEKLEGQTSSSPIGQAKVAFLQPLLMKFFPGKSPADYAKMLQNPDAAAQQMGIPAEVYKSEVEAKMKASELGLQGRRLDLESKKAEDENKNRVEERKQAAAREKLAAAEATVKESSWLPSFLGGTSHKDTQDARHAIANYVSSQEAPSAPEGRVTVIAPDGKTVGHIPQSQLRQALAKGYKQQ